MGFVRSDLEFILTAVRAAEDNARADPYAAAGADASLRGVTTHQPSAPPTVGPSAAWMTLYAHLFDCHFEAAAPSGSGARFVPLSATHFVDAHGPANGYAVLQSGRSAHVAPLQQDPERSEASYSDAHPAQLALLQAYVLRNGAPVATGALLCAADGARPDEETVRRNAKEMLAIELGDDDFRDAPLLATDPFGALETGDRGQAQLVCADGLRQADPAAPADASPALRCGRPILQSAALLPVEKHNRAVEQIQAELLRLDDAKFLQLWLSAPVDADKGAEQHWNGALLFQAARYATEMAIRGEAFSLLQDGAQTAAEEQTDVGDAETEAEADFDLAFLAELARQAEMESAEPSHDAFTPLVSPLPQAHTHSNYEAIAAEAECAVEVIRLTSLEAPANESGADLEVAESAEATTSEVTPVANKPQDDYDL